MSNISDCAIDQILYSKWSENSIWTRDELSDYACAYASFRQFQRQADCFKWIIYMIGGILGITSAVLALWTFSNREFDAISFMYHRVINAIELPYMALMLERAIRDYSSPAFLHSHSWATFFAVVSGKIDNALPTCVNIITLFISVERAVACLAPTHFSSINRPCVVWAVLISAIGISILIWTPSSFAHTTMYDNRTDPVRYMPVWTEWGKSSGYRSYNLIRHALTSVGATLMVLASVTAVIGLRRTAARNLRRYSSASRTLLAVATNGAHPNGFSEYWCLLRQLSYLQLCETVPLIFLHIFLVIAESIHWDYKGGGAMAPSEMTFSQAMHILSLAKTKQRMVVCLTVSNVAAHCFHFYWYLIFCPKVRRGFTQCMRYHRRRAKSSVSSVMRNGYHVSLASMGPPQNSNEHIRKQSVTGTPSIQKYHSKFSSTNQASNMNVTFL